MEDNDDPSDDDDDIDDTLSLFCVLHSEFSSNFLAVSVLKVITTS